MPKSLPLLEQLPGSFLTELDLVWEEAADQQALAGCAPRLSDALSRLTALRMLQLQDCDTRRDVFLPGLAALTNLTSLGIDRPLATLQHLPPQLLVLELQTSPDDDGPLQAQLGCLTALTNLHLHAADGATPTTTFNQHDSGIKKLA